MKYFILAGEASGDKQAGLLCEALARHDPASIMTGWGGEYMMQQGVKVTKHYRDLAFMGFVEVIKHLPAILRNFRTCKEEILRFQPDALILVDYPGFNLRMASWAYKHGIRVYYYISPQLWAWHTSRVHQIKKAVRKMYVILPFEENFYHQYNLKVMYIGHPLAMEIAHDDQYPYQPQPGHVALLPGSRKHEVQRILPEMAGLIDRMPDTFFHVAAVSHLDQAIYDQWLKGKKNVNITSGDMKRVLSQCEAAIVTSGTATLETALHGVPQIVVYKGTTLSYYIARRLIKVKYISLVNLIMDQSLVPELIQSDCTSQRMQDELLRVLHPERKQMIMKGYQILREMLNQGGGASTAAEDIIRDLNAQLK